MLTYVPIEAITAIIGALIGSWATYRLSIDISSRQAAHARELADRVAARLAANNLRSAFAPQLSKIRRDQTVSADEIQRILEPSLDMHCIEMEKFRFYISPKDIPAYDEACKEYQSIAGIRAMNYKSFGGKYPYKVFDNKIHGILKFTKL